MGVACCALKGPGAAGGSRMRQTWLRTGQDLFLGVAAGNFLSGSRYSARIRAGFYGEGYIMRVRHVLAVAGLGATLAVGATVTPASAATAGESGVAVGTATCDEWSNGSTSPAPDWETIQRMEAHARHIAGMYV